MKSTTLAYLAGAIDSDGTIGVRRSTYAMRNGGAGQAMYSERVGFRQVTDHIVVLLKDAFGGYIYTSKPSAANGRPLFSWEITDAKAHACLTALTPFLTVKKAQALNAMALRPLKKRSAKIRVAKGRGHAGGASRPQEITDAMEEIYLQSKRLNTVGI